MASAPKYRCSPRAPRRRACTCHERLLPAHCGHKKASGNNEHKKATANNYVPPMPARRRARHDRRMTSLRLTQPPAGGTMPGVTHDAASGMALTRQYTSARRDSPNRGGGITGIRAAGRVTQDDRIAPCQGGYRTNPSMARWGGVMPHPPDRRRALHGCREQSTRLPGRAAAAILAGPAARIIPPSHAGDTGLCRRTVMTGPRPGGTRPAGRAAGRLRSRAKPGGAPSSGVASRVVHLKSCLGEPAEPS